MFKNKNIFFMNPNKRPRPAIPLLVHVDNPTEAASVTVDTSAVEGKLNTVISNQERIYEKIPTSTGGGGGGTADMTTVNEKTTALADAVGTTQSTATDTNLIGLAKNLATTIGWYGTSVVLDGNTVRSLLSNIRNSVGDATVYPTETGNTIRSLLYQARNMSETTSQKTTALASTVGSPDDGVDSNTLSGKLRRIVGTLGKVGELPGNNSVYAFLNNIKTSIGTSSNEPNIDGSSVRDLLAAIKANTASGGGGGGGGGSSDLTIVNEKTTALATAIGTADDTSSTVSVIGLLKSITDKY